MNYVALVDDHVLLRQGLAQLIDTFPMFQVLYEADNGKDFLKKLKPPGIPDVVLMDISMPEMNGYETTTWLKANYPNVKVIALTMFNDEAAIIRILRCGAKGYLLKNATPAELRVAMEDVINKGYHFNELVSHNVLSNFGSDAEKKGPEKTPLTHRELQFLLLACTDAGYKEIAETMHLSPRTIEKFRNSLFEKFNVKTRIGLVLNALREKYIEI